LEAAHIAFAEEITGLLPAEDVARRVRPGRAVIGLVAGKEIEEQRGLAEAPLARLVAAEDVAEQLPGLLAVEAMLLVGRALTGVARRDRQHADADIVHAVVEELRHPLGIGVIEQGGVGVDAEALGLGEPDRLDRLVVDAVLANRLVVMLAVAVEMDRERQIGRRREQMKFLLERQGVGAEDDVLLAGDEARD